MSSSCRQWQRHMAGSPQTALALQPDPSAMQVDDRSCDMQPNAQARIGSTNIAATKEALEYALLLAIGNTNTRIADCKPGQAIIGVCSPQQYADHPALVRELERIADNRANHLGHAHLVETAWQRYITTIEHDRVLLIGGPIFLNDMIDDPREISRMPIDC